MKKILLFLSLIVSISALAQTPAKGYLRYDSLYIERIGGNAELILKNATRDSVGFLLNKGGGRTEFRKALTVINDTTFLIGADTLKISAGISNINGVNSIVKVGTNFQFVNDTVFTTSPGAWAFVFDGIQLGWRPSTRVVLSDFQNGDDAYFIDSLTIGNRHPTDQTCNNTTNIGLSHINGLVYAYPSGFYNIACVQYTIATSGTFALDAFTGTPGQFRTDAVVLQANAGIVILKGDNSDDQVGGTQTVDPATQILLSYITINSDGVVINVSSTTIYYDNLAGEWTHTIFGAPTINFAYGTNPLAPSDSSIRLTVLPNNSGFRFTSPTTQSSAGKRLTFFIRHDAIVNNARNWVLRKMNGITQVSGSAAITLTAQRGYNKTAAFNTQWQLISIDMADFGGQDAFTGFEWRNTGVGGTVNQQIDSIRVESGVNTVPPPTTTGNFLQLNHTFDNTVVQNGYTTTFTGGNTIFKNKDSIGNYIDIDWTTGALPSTVTNGLGTASISFSATGTTISGTLGKNLSNSLSFQKYVGSEDFTITWSEVVPAKTNTTYGGMTVIPPSTGIGQGVIVQHHLADTSLGYLSYMGVVNPPDYNYTTKHISILHWSALDTLDHFIQKSRRSILAKVTNRSTGAETRMDVKEITNQVGVPSLYFYSGTKLIEHLKIRIDQVAFPKVIFTGTSIVAGYYASTYQGGYPQLVSDAVGGHNTLMAGSAEAILDGEKRVQEVIDAHPESVVVDYLPNDVITNIDSVGKRYRRVVARLVAAGIKVVLCTGVNSGTSLVSRNDTLKAIAASYASNQVQIADIYAVNVDPAGGTAINPDYDFDGIHFNNNGHRSASTVVIGALKKLITFQPAQIRMQLPVTSNTDLPVIRVGTNNELFSSYTPQDTSSILNKKTISSADIQHANSNIDGEMAMHSIQVWGGGTLNVSPTFQITPSGAITMNPFTVNGGGLSTIPGGITQQDGHWLWFSGGAFIEGFTQPVRFQTRNAFSASGNMEQNNLDENHDLPSGFLWNKIYKTVSGVTTQIGGINRRGGFFGDTAFHYMRRIPYSEFGASDIYDKATIDSLIAAGGGGGGGGATAFTGLSDVPASYSGQALKIVRVNAGETALEFASGAGAGADAQLSNLSGTTAVPVAILPATDNAIALGSAAKRWTNLLLANGASINWNNGTSLITSTGGSSMAIQADNGLFQFYKSGQQAEIQAYNSTLADGIDIKAGSQAIDPISATSYINLASTSARSIGIGGVPTSKLTLFGSLAVAYAATATGVTLDGTNGVVKVTATGQTITLPTAVGITGRQYTIKLTASGSCTIATTSSQTIDGSTTYSLASQYKYATVVSDGANWIVVANN